MPEEKTREQYAAEILDFLTKKAGPRSSPITLEMQLVKDVGLDSLENVEIIMDLEDKYDTNIPDQIAATFKTGNDVVDYLNNPMRYVTTRNIQQPVPTAPKQEP